MIVRRQRMFRYVLTALGAIILALSGTAAEPGLKVQFVGGTLSGVSPKTTVRLDLTSADRMLFQSGKTNLEIPYQKINAVEYGQNVSRRYVEAVLLSPVFLLAKSHRHYVTVG